MNILVTGGAGYIGTACTRSFLDSGHQVTVFDNLVSGQRDKVDSRASFVLGDITDRDVLDGLFTKEKFDMVVHLAALKSVGEGETEVERYYYVNVVGTMNVLAAMKNHAVTSIMFSSTAAVYQQNRTGMYREGDAIEAMSVYGSTKVLCEGLIKQYARLGYVEQYIIFRYFNLAGDAGLDYVDSAPQNVFPLLAQSVMTGSEFSIFGDDYSTVDGTGVRDYVHLQDLVSAHLLALDRPVSGVFNLGTTTGTSVKQLVHVFETLSGQTMNYSVTQRRPGDCACALADCSKAERELSWKPQCSITDMVQSTLDTYGNT